jgi:hypothetical protein
MTTATNDAVVTLATVELMEAGLSNLRDKVVKLNKRAARHGMVPLVMTVLSTETIERPVTVGGIVRMVPDVRHTVEINGCEPCINGWALAANIEFNDTIGNVVRIAPGRDDDGSYIAYRTVGPVCEHCNSRRRRNDVFVLEHRDGRRKIVGRNCLADYVRSGDAAALAAWAEMMDCVRLAGGDADPDELGRDDYSRDRGNPVMPLEPYLRIVAVVKRKFGWMGRTAARDSFDGTATADDANYVIYGRGRGHDAWVAENELFAHEEDADYVGNAIEWAKTLCDDDNEYRNIIGRIAAAGCVDMRKLDGYAASILIAYDKNREREIEYAARAAGAKNKDWFGCEGKREKGIPVKCVGLHSFEGHYGVTTIVRLEHYPDGADGADRACLVWFASGDKYNDWDVDAEYTIDATIKGHDDHDKYGKQTKINRVKQL